MQLIQKNYQDQLKPESNNIIQVGANDGIVGEEYGFIEIVKNHNNNVVMVEPIPEYLNTLKQTVSGAKSNIRFLNAGIRNKQGVDKITLEGGLSSFKGQFGHRPSIVVKVINTKDLLEFCKFDVVDLLLLDTEGCEREIVEDLDLQTNNIRTIRWEYHNLTQEDNEFIMNKLSQHGFTIGLCSHDSKHNFIGWRS
jgi:hypothetical protein